MSQETPVAIFWDIDRIPLPSESPTYEIVNKITDKAHEDGFVVTFKAYSDVPELVNGGSARYDLQAAGVSFVGCAQDGTKNVTISTDMLVYAMDHPAPATLVVISDDNQLTYVCSILRMRKHRVVVVSSSHAGHLMKRRASAFVDWSELMGAISEDDDPDLFSRLVQSTGDDASDAASTSNLLRGSPSEVVSPVSHMKTDARSSLRASSENSDVSSLSSTTLGPEPPDNTCPNNLHCSKYPACHCARWHGAEEIIADHASVGELGESISPGLVTQWISLNQDTKPRQSVSSPAGSTLEAQSPPRELPPKITGRFKSLIAILQQEGDSCLDYSRATTRLKEHVPNAFIKGAIVGDSVGGFARYVTLAEEAGVVTVSEAGALGARVKWISLNPTLRLSGASTDSSMSATAPSKEPPPIPESFSPLVDRLREMRDNNIARPFRWPVHAALITQNPSIYSEVGVGDFSEYAKNAELAGIVTLGGEGQREWISLAVD